MHSNLRPLTDYVHALQKNLAVGNTTEPSLYPGLKSLLESLDPSIVAITQPKRIDCGAPDFQLTKGQLPIGYVEAKDIGKSLDEAEGSEQLTRYRNSLPNLVLTDYLEFRWYVDGERRAAARLGLLAKDGEIKRDKDGTEAVRQLLTDFLSHEPEGIGTPKELAIRLARLAHLIRNLIMAAFEKEPESGTLHAWLAAFRDNLIPDLSPEQFADMYAQTIAYGLFPARCTNTEDKGFTRQNAAYLLPKTNPFLRKLFYHISFELDDSIVWAVDELVSLLAHSDMASILRDFGKRTAKEDPVVHFYETFLAAYDPRVREMRGVYYTPAPVVSYIVRSIDHLLKTRFEKPQGLADEKTLILDPAVGTATFLYMVVNEIHQAMVSQGQKGMWNDYVTEKLLPRLLGFELLMAPYAVAHLKLGLLLLETGYQFRGDQRLGIYLTNTLEEAIKRAETLFAGWIAEEANAAAEIKKDKPIMVVLGNPPYSGHSANKGAWAKQLIDTYKTVDGKPLGEKNPKWLQDDYVKFIRFGQWRIERTGQGILGFITNHAYLDNPTFRGMRQSLMSTFTDIYVFDLHGNAKKRETAPDGGKDENVFDIQQGVAIALFVKHPVGQPPSAVQIDGQMGATTPPLGQVRAPVLPVGQPPPAVQRDRQREAPLGQVEAPVLPETARVHHADLWGVREGKYRTLSETDINSTDWTELKPHSPFYLFVPRQESLLAEYEQGWRVTEIFPTGSLGLLTKRDKLVVAFYQTTLLAQLQRFADPHLSPRETAMEFGLPLADKDKWDLSVSKAVLHRTLSEIKVRPLLYRPFDWRKYYDDEAVVARRNIRVLRNLWETNVALVVGRQGGATGSDEWDVLWATNCATDQNLFRRGGATMLPLYLYPSEQEVAGGLYKAEDRRPNLNPSFVRELCSKLRMPLPPWFNKVEQSPSTVQRRRAKGEQAGVPVLPVGQPPLAVQAQSADHEEQAGVPVLPVEQSPPAVQAQSADHEEQAGVAVLPVEQSPPAVQAQSADHEEQAGVPVLPVEQSPSTVQGRRAKGEQAGVPVLPVEQSPPAVQAQSADHEEQAGVPVLPVGQPPSAVQTGPDLTITRRHLPHWQLGGSCYFVTFRVKEGVTLSPEEREIVLQSCLYGHPRSWRLHAAIVMADHVHLLLTPAEVHPNKWISLSKIMRGIKGATAHRINKRRGWKCPLWQDESFDRIIRDEAEFNSKWEYICENAVKAGLDKEGPGYPFFWWEGKEEREISPEDIFNYAYAVFHSPTYRSRYAEFLKIDFPRLPLTSDRSLFKALCEKGAELVALHLMESPALNSLITGYPVAGTDIVERVDYHEQERRVYINKTQYFEGVPPDVWNFPIGGYQVCQKWLKDRKGRKLTYEERLHYQRVVVALKETIRLMAEIDALIPAWPLA